MIRNWTSLSVTGKILALSDSRLAFGVCGNACAARKGLQHATAADDSDTGLLMTRAGAGTTDPYASTVEPLTPAQPVGCTTLRIACAAA
jgi:hypothetical protein